MRNLTTIVMLLLFTFAGFAQQIEPTFTKVDDKVKVTYYHDNGKVKTEGFFKNKKLTGQWITYNNAGKKVQLANYKEGKKVGTWLIWTKDGIREINYENNKIVSVQLVTQEYKLAVND